MKRLVMIACALALPSLATAQISALAPTRERASIAFGYSFWSADRSASGVHASVGGAVGQTADLVFDVDVHSGSAFQDGFSFHTTIVSGLGGVRAFVPLGTQGHRMFVNALIGVSRIAVSSDDFLFTIAQTATALRLGAGADAAVTPTVSIRPQFNVQVNLNNDGGHVYLFQVDIAFKMMRR